MNIKNNKLIKNVFLIFLSLAFASLGGVLLRFNYIEPFFFPETKKVLADPLLIMGFVMGVSSGFPLLAPVNIFFRLFIGRDLKGKTIFALAFIFGVAGFFANIALYQYVIKPKEMIICPREFGHKKNLMRFYVTDLSLCKSD